MRVGSLFSGIGLLDYGLHLAGGGALEHVFFCEADPRRRERLSARWPDAPVYDDVRKVGGDAPGCDVLAGGFPCKGASTAGKREGFGHPETVLWREMARAARELRPRYVVVENVANILALHDGAVWGEVLGDLASLGYRCVWDMLPASAFGAPHKRERVFLVAYAEVVTEREPADETQPIASSGKTRQVSCGGNRASASYSRNGGWGASEPHIWTREQDTTRSTASYSKPRRHAPELAASIGDEAADAVERFGESPAADPELQRRREQHTERLGGAPQVSGTCGHNSQITPDANGQPRTQQDERTEGGLQPPHGHDAGRFVVRVEWGEYEPAIRRWEEILGRPAPAPLAGVRGMDDGSPSLRRMWAGVDRRRLSALGDGVLVAAGWTVGRYLMELEAA